MMKFLLSKPCRCSLRIVLAHHKYYFEKKDSLSGKNNIPLGAEIVAVADAYDAMITDRPYRAGMQPWKAFEEIEKNSGKQFRPDVVRAFKEVLMSSDKYRKKEKSIR